MNELYNCIFLSAETDWSLTSRNDSFDFSTYIVFFIEVLDVSKSGEDAFLVRLYFNLELLNDWNVGGSGAV